MRRLYIPPDRIGGDTIRLATKEVRYLVNVLRLEPGDTVTVFDGQGVEYVTVLQEDETQKLGLIVTSVSSPDRESPLNITLAQGLLKGEKMKFVIQKSTELGVTGILPLITARSVPAIEEERESLRVDRWRIIAQEAARQTGRAVVPRIGGFLTLQELADGHEGAGIVLWEEEAAPLRDVLSRIGQVSDLTVVIGPEGGFSEEEVAMLQRRGWQVAGLGRRILRAETAALTVISIVQHCLGDLG
jgi:16S rRNA (uracil1498-N3)-methyltransferase